MQQLPLSFTETLEIVFYFSSLTLLIGIVVQFLFIIVQDRKLTVKLFLIIGLTQLLAFSVTIALWLKWPFGLRILYGPILFPAVVAEVLMIPIILSFFHYKIVGKRDSVDN